MANRWAKAEKATKKKAKLRMTLQGVAGSGKTYSALKIAQALVELDGDGKKVYVIDTEFGSADKYAHKFDFMVVTWGSDRYDPRELADMFANIPDDCGALVVDSATHFWKSTGGFLQLVDEEAKKIAQRGGRYDTYAAWKEVDKVYNQFVDAILGCRCHIILTMRAKTEYERTEKNGKTKLEKVGMAPEMREGFNYLPDVEGILDQDHCMVIGKTRCDEVDGKVFDKPGLDFAKPVHDWLTTGSEAKPAAKPTVAKSKPAAIGGVPLGPVSEPEPEPMGYDSDEDDEPELLPPELAPVGVVESFTELLNACRSEADLKSVAADIKRSVDDADARAALVGVYRARLAEVKVA